MINALDQLKKGKSDGSSLISDAFILAKDILSKPLSDLFTTIIRHGYVPNVLRDCILQLIPKPGKDPTCSDNYRPIALAPTLSKVLEWCILLTYEGYFSTSPLQFGFKPGMSADMCTGLIKNVIGHYCFKGSSVFGCFLDASKAFDRVSHLKLFNRLLEKNLPPTIIRLLFFWYKDQKSSVLWNKTLSEKFSVSNGVRQGGVLSPILFIVYIDELLIRLQSQAVGCHWSHYFAGAFGYADDIVLLAPSASALRMMLNACCQFATDYNLIFNPGKTKLVRFSLPSSSPSSTTAPIFMFGGQSLTLVDRASHLGHILRSDLSDTDDILRVQTDMCRRANCLLSTFSATNPAVKTLLFRTFCLSLYGSSLWSLASPGLHSLEVTFNNILRKIWKLPRNCHTSILHCVSRLQSLHNVVIQRSKMLCLKARATGFPLIRDIFIEAPILSYTSFGLNILNQKKFKRTYNDEAIACANFIRDVQLFPQVNRSLLQEINYISTC